MFSHGRRRARAARTTTPLIENESAVLGAEDIVRRAWARELLRRREHLEFDLRAARNDEDVARALLASAQRDGEPRKIASARAALDRAVEATGASTQAYDRMRRTLRTELDLMERANRDHALSGLVRQMEYDRSTLLAQDLDVPSAQSQKAESAMATSRARLRVPRALRRLVVRRSARLELP